MAKLFSGTLALFMFAALFIAFGALLVFDGAFGFRMMTGLWGTPGATTYGSTNLTILQNLKINFTDDSANFGSGYLCSGCGKQALTISTEGLNDTACNCGWNIPNGLLLENVGNRYARVNLSNAKASATFIGGSSPGYAMKWETPESTATTCTGENPQNMSGYKDSYANISSVISSPGQVLCERLNFSDNEDTINFSFKLHIPLNAPAQVNSDIWTATAVDNP